MALQSGNDFRPACEPIAWVWREGDDPIGCRPISVADVVDVHLPKIHTISLHIDIVTTTHSASGIECGVTGNNMVSTRKNARSTHVEISKVERFRMRGGRKGERLTARRPQLCHEMKRVGLFLCTPKHVPGIFSGSSLLLSPSFIPQRFALFDVCARLSCMLALSGTYRVQAKRMKHAQGVEGVY